MIEMVVSDQLVDEVVRIVIETARTGDIGDGRIFVLPIEDGHNIRTGERDASLTRELGNYSESSSSQVHSSIFTSVYRSPHFNFSLST